MLQGRKKGSSSINEYLLKIKNVIDRLASVGHPVSSSDHIDAILNGLPEEYDTFVISINSRSESYVLEEIESLLLAQEGRIENIRRNWTPTLVLQISPLIRPPEGTIEMIIFTQGLTITHHNLNTLDLTTQ